MAKVAECSTKDEFGQDFYWAPARLCPFATAPVSTMDRNNFDRNEHTTNPVTACCRIALLL